jgi:hypothetical protein
MSEGEFSAQLIFTGVAALGVSGAIMIALHDLLYPQKTDTESSIYDRNMAQRVSPPTVPRREALRGFVKIARWLSAPIAASSAALVLALESKPILARLPSLLTFYGASLLKVLPLHPRSIQDAFELGIAYRAYMSANGAEAAVAEALQLAAKIAKRPVTVAELVALPMVIDDLMNERGIISRVLSAFSIINILWFIAILGISVTVGPFLYYILEPIRRHLLAASKWLYEQLVRLAKWAIPLYEPLSYVLSLLVLVESARFADATANDAYSMTGSMLGATSIAMFVLSWIYTTVKNSHGGGDKELYLTVSWLVGASFCIPAAKIHQSSLLGYAAVGCVVSALRFSAFSRGLTVFIGFESRQALVRATCACGAMTAACVAVKLVQTEGHSAAHSPWLVPFHSAASIVGSTVYLLGLDINCFRNTARSHAFYIANLAAFIIAGEVLHMPGLANVGKTFFGLLLLTVYCEAMPDGRDGSAIVWVFFLFAFIYGFSMFLSTRPELVGACLAGAFS